MNDMRDRLIELIDGFGDDIAFCDICDRPEEDCEACKNEQLAEYLIENGAIIPPCKVGDTLYDISEFVNGCSYPEIYEYTCEYITIFKDKDGETVFEIDAINFHFNDFGKTVFLTREDAEKALREREGE